MANSTIIKWLIPEKIREDNVTYRQAKLIFGVTICLMLVSVVMALKMISINKTGDGILILICGLLVAIGLLSLKWTGTIFWSGNGIIFLMFTLITFLIGTNKGIFSETIPWYAIIVILGYLITGYRASMFWSVCSISAIVTFFILEISGVQFKPIATESHVFFVSYTVLVSIIIVLGHI